MEKIFSDEEKLRRAIEISQRRRGYYNNISLVRDNGKEKKDYKLFKKMILQIIICLLIYIIFYLINTTNYNFSEEIIKNTNNVLNYDINLNKILEECKKFWVTNVNINGEIQSNIENNITSDTSNIILENIQKNNTVTNNNLENNELEKDKEEDNKEKDIGKEEKNEKETENEIDKKIEKTSMEIDSEKVLKLCKFQKPLSGTITSEFGEREATIEGMTTDHKGIDIAANSGTNIKAAISGTVSVADENSQYGKFIKIVNGDVMTVYAHCKTLKVKVGDKIKIGQTIATVGATGKSTGPHLHFEIRLENRYINPRYVINF